MNYAFCIKQSIKRLLKNIGFKKEWFSLDVGFKVKWGSRKSHVNSCGMTGNA